MSSKIYNVKKVETVKASTGNDRTTGGISYKGFNSKAIKDNFKSYDIDLIKQDLLNHFNIKKGEKLENPEYGTIIWSMIYEPMNDSNLRMIEEDVIRILKSDPRVSVTSVGVLPTEQGLRIEANLKYIEFDISQELFFLFNKDNAPGA